jgi:hypothetical protein
VAVSGRTAMNDEALKKLEWVSGRLLHLRDSL